MRMIFFTISGILCEYIAQFQLENWLFITPFEYQKLVRALSDIFSQFRTLNYWVPLQSCGTEIRKAKSQHSSMARQLQIRVCKLGLFCLDPTMPCYCTLYKSNKQKKTAVQCSGQFSTSNLIYFC